MNKKQAKRLNEMAKRATRGLALTTAMVKKQTQRKAKAQFAVGNRVRLPGDSEEGLPEEYGVIEEMEEKDMFVVRVDEKYITEDGDDGLREVSAEDMQRI